MNCTWFQYLHLKTFYGPNKKNYNFSVQLARVEAQNDWLGGISWACDFKISHLPLLWKWPHTFSTCDGCLLLPLQPAPSNGTDSLFLYFYFVFMRLHLQSDFCTRSTLALQEGSSWEWLRCSSGNDHPGEVDFTSKPWPKAFARN